MTGTRKSEARWRHFARMPDNIVTLALSVFLLGALSAVFEGHAERALWLFGGSFACFLLFLYVFEFGHSTRAATTGNYVRMVILCGIGFLFLWLGLANLVPI